MQTRIAGVLVALAASVAHQIGTLMKVSFFAVVVMQPSPLARFACSSSLSAVSISVSSVFTLYVF